MLTFTTSQSARHKDMADKTTNKKGKSYHHGDLPRALKDETLKLVVEKGIGNLTLREVARRIGVTHAAPYRHFADKAALLAAVAEEGFRKMGGLMAEIQAKFATDPVTRFRELGRCYIEFAVLNPAYLKIMVSPEVSGRAIEYPGLLEASTTTYRTLVEAVVDCQKTGALRSLDPASVANVAWSLVHGISVLVIDGLLPTSGREEVEKLGLLGWDILLDGLRT